MSTRQMRELTAVHDMTFQSRIESASSDCAPQRRYAHSSRCWHMNEVMRSNGTTKWARAAIVKHKRTSCVQMATRAHTKVSFTFMHAHSSHAYTSAHRALMRRERAKRPSRAVGAFSDCLHKFALTRCTLPIDFTQMTTTNKVQKHPHEAHLCT